MSSAKLAALFCPGEGGVAVETKSRIYIYLSTCCLEPRHFAVSIMDGTLLNYLCLGV